MHKNTFGLDSHVCVYQLEKHGSLSHGSVSNWLAHLSGCLSIVKCKVCLTLCACTSKLRPRDGYLYSLGTVICMGTTIQKLDSHWLNRGVLCCFALFVCLTLLASFFLPSHLSFKNMYILIFIGYL